MFYAEMFLFGISILFGLLYIILQVYDGFFRKDLPDYHRDYQLRALHKLFYVSLILGFLLSIVELFL
jgi:hypothetical protein